MLESTTLIRLLDQQPLIFAKSTRRRERSLCMQVLVPIRACYIQLLVCVYSSLVILVGVLGFIVFDVSYLVTSNDGCYLLQDRNLQAVRSLFTGHHA